MRVFLAGATGAIGRRLVPQLVAAGHEVTATTTSPAKVELLRRLGATPVVVDGLDAAAVGEAVARARPDAIVHQMTGLAGIADLRRFDRTFAKTNELRTNGTDHLLAGALSAGARRLIVQGFAGWPTVREGGPVKTEDDPLDPNPPATMRETLDAFRYLERVVPRAEGIEGLVLRYGGFYGPPEDMPPRFLEMVRKRRFPIVGDGGGVWSFIHLADAADATIAALDHGAPGIYNIVDDDPAPVAEWLPAFADAIGAKPPRHVPRWLGRIAGGEAGVSMMTQVRGASNAKAKRELQWEPRHPSWREGFRDALGAARPAGAAA